MALGKMLTLGGMDNSSPQTTQTQGNFRVARNVYPTPDGRIIPRYSTEVSTGSAYDRAYLASYPYDDRILELIASTVYSDLVSDWELLGRLEGTKIPVSDSSGSIDTGLLLNRGDYSQAVTTHRRNNTVYFHIPWGSYLIKYDGVEISKAGVDTPRFKSSAYNSAGTKYVKVIKHTIDFDITENASETVTFPVLAATTVVPIAGVNPGGDIVGNPNVTPKFVSIDSITAPNRFRGTTVYQAGSNDLLVTPTSTNITDSYRIGSYVIVAYNLTKTAAYLETGFGLALKVKSISPLVLDMNSAKLYNKSRVWVTKDLDPLVGNTIAAATTHGDREFLSVWASSSLEGVYSYQAFLSAPLLTAESTNVTIANPPSLTVAGSADNIIILGPTLNEIYAVTSVKQSPNSLVLAKNIIPFGMTTYLDLMVIYDDDLLYFTDYTLGGSFEMFESSNSIKVGDRSGGRITSVCGTQNFLFISRERKNYYLSGDIATGNYKVQEIAGTELGAWCNNASINIKDFVVFISPTGVYQVGGGGRVSMLSNKIPKNFSKYDNFPNPSDDVVFKLDGYGTHLAQLNVAGTPFTMAQESLPGLAVGYDEFRELLVFSYKQALSPFLVIHMKTGEMYEWDGLGLKDSSSYQVINSITFLNSDFYLGGIGTMYGNGAPSDSCDRFRENKSQATPDYVGQNPVLLYSSWVTAGEPSLEKQLLQLKMFGRVKTNGTTSGLKVIHWKDWQTSTVGTFSDYYPDVPDAAMSAQTQYSHKKRLDSDKVLAASVGIGIFQTGTTFELESLEVEFMSIQQGVKK